MDYGVQLLTKGRYSQGALRRSTRRGITTGLSVLTREVELHGRLLDHVPERAVLRIMQCIEKQIVSLRPGVKCSQDSGVRYRTVS